jgi:chemotaxis protein MotB
MEKFASIVMVIISAAILNSCAPVYRCGDQKPDKQPGGWSKRLKSVVTERDELCNGLATERQKNSELNKANSALTASNNDLSSNLNTLTARHKELQKNYDNLINENLSQSDHFNKAMQLKSDELNEKERLLSDREKALEEMRRIIARQDSITSRLNSTLHNALLGFNPDELSVEIKNGKVYVSMTDKLLFRSGSSTVEDKGRQALKLLSDVLQKNPDIDILIEGHTDNVPIRTQIYKDNWDLSVARATSIVRILSSDYKIPPARMTASGRGEYFPRADNDTPEGRAKNRRTEIILSPRLDELMQLINNK